MADRRQAGVRWHVAEADGSMPTWERVGVAVLMDIRDELQKLNALLHCHNFTSLPASVRSIRLAMPPRRKRRKAKA